MVVAETGLVRAQQSDISQIGTWARTAGGSGIDRARSQAIDKDQNIYIAGQFENSTTFSGGGNSVTLSSNGGSDIFIVKYDKCGTLLWAKSIGDDGEDVAKSIVVDDPGNFYITGYFENIVDFNRLTFGSQFTSGGFDPSLPSGEYFPMGLKPYFDVNTGMVYSYNDGENSMYIGSSVYHAGKPRFSLFQDSVSRIPRRYTIHGGANFYLGRNTYHRMIISGIYMQQAKATEFTLGMAYGHYIGNEYDAKYVYMGAFYRKGDAVYPYISLQMNDMQIGISYDVNTSRVKNIAPRYGSIELTFIYTKPDDKEQKRLMPWNY